MNKRTFCVKKKGPLHVKNDTGYQIVGVVSWGEGMWIFFRTVNRIYKNKSCTASGCAKPNYPGVYARVNRYGTWIRSNTKDACYC